MASTSTSDDENVEVPPILALPSFGLQNELEKIENAEVIFHSVLTGPNAAAVSGASCLWYFVVQSVPIPSKKPNKNQIPHAPRVPVILATAVLNADDYLCFVFRGRDQQPLPIHFQIYGAPNAQNNEEKNDLICHWRNGDSEVAATVKGGGKSAFCTLDGVHGQCFGQLTNVKRSSTSSHSLPSGQIKILQSTHSFESEMLEVANVTHYTYKDRSNSTLPYFEANEAVDRVVFRMEFLKDSNAAARSNCVGITLSLACQDVVTYFNPNAATISKAPKAKKERSRAQTPTTSL